MDDMAWAKTREALSRSAPTLAGADAAHDAGAVHPIASYARRGLTALIDAPVAAACAAVPLLGLYALEAATGGGVSAWTRAGGPASGVIETLAASCGWVAYHAVAEWRWGRTVGKWAAGTRVLAEGAGGLTPAQAVWRTCCRWIPFDALSIFLGHERCCWHDILSRTYVVQAEPRRAMGADPTGPGGAGAAAAQAPPSPPAMEAIKRGTRAR